MDDFPQTKFDNGINSPFLLNKHGDPRKNIIEDEKGLIVEHDYFLESSSLLSYWVYFGQGEEIRLTTELSEKVQYSRSQAIKNGVNEAILLMSINEALLSRQNFVPFK